MKLKDILAPIDVAYTWKTRYQGGLDIDVKSFQPFDKAGIDDLTFSTSGIWADVIKPKAAAIIVMDAFDLYHPPEKDFTTYILTADPKHLAAEILRKWFVSHPTNLLQALNVASGSRIGPNVTIMEPCIVGDNVIFDGNTFIYPKTTIGNGVRIGACSAIGVAANGDYKDINGKWHRFPQIGGVAIGDDTVINGNVTIARGTFIDTIIGTNCHIESNSFISHNCIIGDNTSISCGVNIAGSVSIGKDVWIAPGATIRNKVVIGDGAFIGMGSVVVKDVEPNTTVMGVPARMVPDNLGRYAA